jgi:pimeloyl-ACP methyl ester carboxylesterase
VSNPINARRVVRWTFDEFRYAFVHTTPEPEALDIYDTYVTPETGRIFFQVGLSVLAPRSPFVVDFDKADRGPLLLVAGGLDQIVPASLNRANYRKYRHSSAVTDFAEFPGRTHWIIAQAGWQEVAEHVDGWLRAHQ